ncbi:MAG: beta-propeller domain-containing protein [Ilumatobacteraceae bacterium]|nr:beta-propeller domain-containing protein [Ilumatobacteraceae bacterium]
MRAIPALIASLALAASACSANGETADPRVVGSTTPSSTEPGGTTNSRTDGTPASGGTGGSARFPQALTPFSDCSTFLDHVKAEARERVGPYGLNGSPWGYWGGEDVIMDEMATADDAAETAEAPVGNSDTTEYSAAGDDGSYTGTNVQELGVDEPDIVKTDGTRILTVSENRLSYIDVTGDPTLTDTLVVPEGWGHQLFIRGDRALLFTNGGQWGYPMPIDIEATDDAESDFASGDIVADMPFEQFGPATLILDVDLSDPTDLRIAATMRIEGQYLSARAIDERVRLAVTSPPSQLPWLFPQNQNGEDRAEEANRAIIDESTLADWLPDYELDADGSTISGTLLSCERAHRPAEFSGFDMVSIVDLDLDTGLAGAADRIEAVGVLAGGQTVYSSTDRMYVATTKWIGQDLVDDADRVREWTEEFETELHSFAIAAGEPTRYVASGAIAGSLLNQFALDEHDGYLRAITTDGSPWSQDGESETHLVVFEEQGDQLVPVGEVGGLGKGEQLYSARLMGDVGFAVTFRQIDPFYVLDLSDPTNPRVTGELKIPGFSTYLHPVGDDRVLGIGQAATEDGRTTGLKLSLFDVSDPADPREVSIWTQPDSNSPVEWDHRAFQMFGSTAIVPVQSWTGDFNGAVLFDIGDGITEVGRVTQVPADTAPSSDCREITSDDLTQDASELYWMTTDGHAHVQLCEPDAIGGWGSWYCDRLPVDEIAGWYGDSEATERDLDAIGADGDDVIEICWSDGGYQESIQRSLVIGETLWTLTPSAAQANALDGLGVITQISLR